LLDISPTRIMYAGTDMDFATAYYHWFFLIQPFDLPERLIGADPIYYLHRKLSGLSSRLQIFDPRALAEYERCFRDPATIHATCEDIGRRRRSIRARCGGCASARECPLLRCGSEGRGPPAVDPIADKSAARDVRGKVLPSGITAEEVPEETLAGCWRFSRVDQYCPSLRMPGRAFESRKEHAIQYDWERDRIDIKTSNCSMLYA
jgi:haloacetate dehalogenase